MISVLCPTRNRVEEFTRMVQSCRDTAESTVNIVAYIDHDDPAREEYLKLHVSIMVGPRVILSDMFNKCASFATGEIYMMGGDDMMFRTPGWDTMIEEEFRKSRDKILMVYGDDGINNSRFSAFPTIHKRWLKTVGYFAPPYFVGDYADTWLRDVALALGRAKYLPYMTEHLHFIFDKAPYDDTYRERREREAKENPSELYAKLLPKRLEDIEKLRAVMR
jgi:hypothetical protein